MPVSTGTGKFADAARQFIVIQPCQVIDGATPTDDDDGVGLCLAQTLPAGQCFEQCLAHLSGRAFALEAAVDDDEAAKAPSLQPFGFGLEVAQAGGALRVRRR